MEPLRATKRLMNSPLNMAMGEDVKILFSRRSQGGKSAASDIQCLSLMARSHQRTVQYPTNNCNSSVLKAPQCKLACKEYHTMYMVAHVAHHGRPWIICNSSVASVASRLHPTLVLTDQQLPAQVAASKSSNYHCIVGHDLAHAVCQFAISTSTSQCSQLNILRSGFCCWTTL